MLILSLTYIRIGIEVVITALTRNQVVLTGSWVRIPPYPPKIPFTIVDGIFSSYFLPFTSYLSVKPARDFWKERSNRWCGVSFADGYLCFFVAFFNDTFAWQISAASAPFISIFIDKISSVLYNIHAPDNRKYNYF